MTEVIHDHDPGDENVGKMQGVGVMQLYYSEEAGIRDLLVGRRIVSTNDNVLVLDDGTRLVVIPNDGCGGCSSGSYGIDKLEKFESVITSVRFEDSEESANEYAEDPHTYRIFVLSADKEQLALQVSGDDGNGYYGSGYSLRVVPQSVPSPATTAKEGT